MKKTPALELRDVSYVAGGKSILHSINWTVRRGEHWAILGPNGSGKTTLTQIGVRLPLAQCRRRDFAQRQGAYASA